MENLLIRAPGQCLRAEYSKAHKLGLIYEPDCIMQSSTVSNCTVILCLAQLLIADNDYITILITSVGQRWSASPKSTTRESTVLVDSVAKENEVFNPETGIGLKLAYYTREQLTKS